MATIQEVYIALFGRPADPAGLEYYVDVTNDGANLDAVGDLSASPEYTDRFEGLNNNQKVTQIYLDLFNRTPDAAGLAFYVNLLNTGAATEQDIAIRIIDGATGDDDEIIANKVEAANAFTASIDTPTEIGAYVGDNAADAGRAFLAGITSDPATIPDQAAIDQAIMDIENGVGTGITLDLTLGAETLDGTAGGDLFLSVQDGGVNTLDAGDVLNGGQSVDTLDATVTGLVGAAELNSVENLFFTSAGGAIGFDLENSTGVQQVWSNDSDFAASNATSDIIYGVQNATAGVAYTVDFADDALDDDATLKLAVANNDGNTVTVTSADDADVDGVSVNVMGGETVLDLGGLTNAEDVTVTGAGELEVSLGAGVEDFDSTALDGDLTLNVGAADVTAELGDGDNSTFGGTGDIDITGGAGEDTLRAGDGDSVLDGGDGNDIFGGAALATADAQLTGGAGNDEFHFNTASTGNTITDFTVGEDVISLLQGGGAGGLAFDGSVDNGLRGTSDLGDEDFNLLGSFSQLDDDNDGTLGADFDGELVVFTTSFADDAALTGATAGSATGALYFVAYNEDAGNAQLYYTADANSGTNVLVADIEGLDLAGVQALTANDFDIYI